MEQNDLQRAIEAILFASGEPVDISRLAMTLEADEKDISFLTALVVGFDNIKDKRQGDDN